MKLKICLTLILLSCGSCLFVFSQPVEQQNSAKTLPIQIIQLEKAIQTASYDPEERNSTLRYQRAVLYYASAKQHFQLNWRKQAIDDAQRGIKLLEMNELANQSQPELVAVYVSYPEL